MRRASFTAVLLIYACACSSSSTHAGDAGSNPGIGPALPDSDHDGLCDTTESDLGTDPHALDSDHDGLPDLIEIGNGFDPSDPNSPASDQLAQLQAVSGASLDFPVRVTIDGEGQGATGTFQSISSIYGDGSSAADYFMGAIAVSADPTDAPRSIEIQGARFDAVLGHTRLTYSIHFEYAVPTAGPFDCRRAYPFRYGVKGDDGQIQTERLFLLVVSPTMGSRSMSFCLPFGCQ